MWEEETHGTRDCEMVHDVPAHVQHSCTCAAVSVCAKVRTARMGMCQCQAHASLTRQLAAAHCHFKPNQLTKRPSTPHQAPTCEHDVSSHVAALNSRCTPPQVTWAQQHSTT
jgi:hypothetical protein